MKKVFALLVVLSGLLVLVLACSPAPAPATPKPTQPPSTSTPAPAPKPAVIRWRGQSAYPAAAAPSSSRFPYPYWGTGQAGQYYADWIKEATGGRLIIDIAPPGGVVPVNDMFTATSKGTLDFAGLYYGGYHTGLMPETDIEIGLPFAWENAAEEWDALYNWGLKKEFEKIYAESGIWPEIFGCDGTYQIIAVGQATTPDWVKGKKIRATGIYGKYIQALGGSPVTIPTGELYMGMKLGTIDGTINGDSVLTNVKLNEVANSFVVYPNMSNIGGSFLFNQKSLDALPEDIRNLIYRDTKHIARYFFTGVYATENSWSILISKKAGIKAITYSEEDAAKVRKIGIGLWDEIAAKSPRTAKLVEIVKAQARDLGKIK